MVKPNPKDSGIHSKSVVLEDSDRERIRQSLEQAPITVEEIKISNPTNGFEALYIQVSSANREDVLADKTRKCLKRAAGRIGYNGATADFGVPSKHDPSGFSDYLVDYYTLSARFKQR